LNWIHLIPHKKMYWGWVPVLETVCFTIENKSIQSPPYLKNETKNLLSIGSQDSQNSSHQIQYSHLYKKSWLFGTFKNNSDWYRFRKFYWKTTLLKDIK
jgi:hypothetical protein